MSFKKTTSVSLRTFSSFASGVEMLRNDEWYSICSMLGATKMSCQLWDVFRQASFMATAVQIHSTNYNKYFVKKNGWMQDYKLQLYYSPADPYKYARICQRALNLNLWSLTLYKVEIYNDDVLLLKLFTRRWKIYHRYCTSSVPL